MILSPRWVRWPSEGVEADAEFRRRNRVPSRRRASPVKKEGTRCHRRAPGVPLSPRSPGTGPRQRGRRARRDALWQFAHRPLVAQPTVERVLLVLRYNRLDGRQFEHLMSMRFGVLAMQQPRARLALLRDTGNNLLDLFQRHQERLVPLVSVERGRRAARAADSIALCPPRSPTSASRAVAAGGAATTTSSCPWRCRRHPSLRRRPLRPPRAAPRRTPGWLWRGSSAETRCRHSRAWRGW